MVYLTIVGFYYNVGCLKTKEMFDTQMDFLREFC